MFVMVSLIVINNSQAIFSLSDEEVILLKRVTTEYFL